MTFLDLAVNTFFLNAGSDLLPFLFGGIIVWAIISALLRPFEV